MKNKFILLAFLAVAAFGFNTAYAQGDGGEGGDAEGERIVFIGELPMDKPESGIPVVEAFIKDKASGNLVVKFNESVGGTTTKVTNKNTGEVVYKSVNNIVDSQTLPITIDGSSEDLYTLDIETPRGSVQGDFSIGAR